MRIGYNQYYYFFLKILGIKIPNNLDFFDIEIKKKNHSPRSLLLPSPPPIITDINTFPSIIDSLTIENHNECLNTCHHNQHDRKK